MEEIAMRLRTMGRRVLPIMTVATLAGAAGLFSGAQPAAAATAPHISVSLVNNKAQSLKVTGTNFAKNAAATVEFTQNGANSGDMIQQFQVATDRNGKFTTTQKAYITSACLVGITAWDSAHFSNDVEINTTGKGCSGAKLSVDPCSPVCTDFATTGTGFTPGDEVDVTYQFTDAAGNIREFDVPSPGGPPVTGCQTTPGEWQPGQQIKAPDGTLAYNGDCRGFVEHSDLFCQASVVFVWAYDLNVDYQTPTLAVDPRC
jgi:hypothetical protein